MDNTLHNAARRGDTAAATVLVGERPHLLHQCDATFGSTPLHWAAKNRNVELTNLLLDAGADIDATDSTGRTPLQWVLQHDSNSVYDDRRPIIRLLMTRGATHSFETAIGRGTSEHLKSWIERGTSVSAPLPNGSSPLAAAAEHGDAEVVKLLLESGAPADGESFDLIPPLIRAIKADRPEIVQILLDRGADTECGTDNVLPLDVVVQATHRSSAILVADLLLQYGARVTPQLAASRDDLDLLSRALKDFEIDRCDGRGATALYVAAETRHPIVTEALLEAGANPDIGNRAGDTPLHVAARFPFMMSAVELTTIARLLLQAGADPNARNTLGETPLHSALQQLRSSGVNVDVVQLLVAAGADSNLIDHDGKTPLESDRSELHIGPGDAEHLDEIIKRRKDAIARIKEILNH